MDKKMKILYVPSLKRVFRDGIIVFATTIIAGTITMLISAGINLLMGL